MIRKTSLLRKIEPTTRRSSFVGKDRNTEAMQAKRSCANPGDYIDRPQIALQILYSDRSPLYDVRNPASNIRKDITSEVMLSRNSNDGCPNGACREHTMKKGDGSGFNPWSLDHRRHPSERFLVEADGIEPTTSCLQSTRSPS
jgi:hypothetical protein